MTKKKEFKLKADDLVLRSIADPNNDYLNDYFEVWTQSGILIQTLTWSKKGRKLIIDPGGVSNLKNLKFSDKFRD